MPLSRAFSTRRLGLTVLMVLGQTATGQSVLVSPVNYTMPNGGSGVGHYWDTGYSGKGCRTCDGASLSGGVGLLSDGVTGTDDFLADKGSGPAAEWMGWKVEPVILFEFARPESFSTIRIHSNNRMAMGVGLWDSVILSFSEDGTSFGDTFEYTTSPAERKNPKARFIDIALPRSVSAKYIKCRFLHSSEWMFISEVQFVVSPPSAQ